MSPSPAETTASPPRRLAIDWHGKLRHFMLMLAFCLAISLVHYAFLPHKPYAPALTFSLCIGLTAWLIIDFGRHAIPSSAETSWPRGWQGVALVVAGNVIGFLFGTSLAEAICVYFGWFGGPRTLDPAAALRDSLLISLVAGLIGSYFFYSRSKGDYLLRRVREVQRHADEARLKLLETQLEPHMLFNTLANLRALIGIDPPRAQRMLDHMIAYLRATLDASRATTHSLQTEVDRLRDYLELMSIRMGPRLAYTLAVPPELAQQPVPTLLLQPLVENSIQHGLEPKVEGGRIDVAARREGEQLVLDVCDTGIGSQAPRRAGPGFGLMQVRERLATLYGTRASLELAPNDSGGMRAVIRLPIA
jgi:signal transduction histidine kinase